MLCMGMVLGVATLLLVIANWLASGVDRATMRVEALHPLTMFTVGVGIRFLGSIITRHSARLLRVMLGDIAAVAVGLVMFFLVAAARDQTKVVVLAAIVVGVVVLPTAAVASLVASGVARSPAAVAVTSGVSLCLLVCVLALQGTNYWA